MRPRLSYANVMATIAVFIALGGVSYATLKLPKNSVGSRQLKKNAVTTAKVKDGSLKAADFGGQLPKGDQGAPGKPGERGPSDAYQLFDQPSENNAKAVSISLPPGNYVVSGSMWAGVSDQVNSDEVLCELTSPADGAHEANSIYTVGPAPSSEIWDFKTVVAESVFALGSGGIVTFSCERIYGDAVVNLYHAQMNAIQVGDLHQGRAAT
jgi:hypothetical protein